MTAAADRWIERYGTAPPIEFSKLLHLIEDQTDVLADIQALLQRKSRAPEMGLSEPVDSINAFIEAELHRLDAVASRPNPTSVSVPQLNKLFQTTLHEQA